MKAILGLIGVVSIVLLTACDSDGTATLSIPEIKPPVQTATPNLLLPASASRAVNQAQTNIQSMLRDTGNCDASGSFSEVNGVCMPNFKDRIFPENGGPTALLDIITGIDNRYKEIVSRSASADTSCLNGTLVEHEFTPFGLSAYTTTFKFQCYDNYTRSGYLVFGRESGTWWLFDRGGAGGRAVKIAPISGTDSDYTVDAYMGVGYNNSSSTSCSSNWDGCSYAAMAMTANSQTKEMEFTFAGVGVGFCGIHLKTDGTYTYVKSSEESPGVACESSADSACLQNSDFTESSGNCTNIDDDNFTLTTLGRQTAAAANVSGTWAASTIPSSGGNIALNGNSDDALNFFPSAATDISGITQFGQSSRR